MSLRILLLMALGHLVVDMHPGGLAVLLPLLREEHGLSYAMVGLLVLLSQVSSSVVQPAFGALSDRISTRWLVPASCLLASAGFVVLLFGDSFVTAAVGVFVMGLGVAAFHPEGSKIAHFASGDRKAWSMSVFALGGNVGTALGPLLMGTALVTFGLPGVAVFLLVSVPAALLLIRHVPEMYARIPPRRQARTGGEQVGAAAANVRGLVLLLLVVAMRSSVHVSMTTFIPLYYEGYVGLGTQAASWRLTVFLASGAVGGLVAGWLADRYGRREVILGSLLLAAPFLWLFQYAAGIWAYPVLMAAGAAVFASFGVTTVLGQELLPNNIGLASGLMLGFSVGTGGIAATFLGRAADVWGLPAALATIALLAAAGAGLAVFLPGRTRALPRPEQVETGASR
ncbi:MAG TPA: MFS transporter [Limnochordales bacterium]